jgi:zinc D-Ala-D-Ala carboxypeptidase
MNLSPHFTLGELTDSAAATRLGIDNTPAPIVVDNLVLIAATLEQIRALVGRPIVVSSGYRCAAVNKAVGSGPTSAHILGLAADITVPGMTARALALLIREGGVVLDQLIYEGTWVHVGLSAGAPRKQVLTATFIGGRASYSQGIA